MPIYYDQLPQRIDRLALANAVREVFLALREELSLSEIVDNVNISRSDTQITDNQLKMFLRRAPSGRVNAKNDTLRALFDYVIVHLAEGGNSMTKKALSVTLQYIDILRPDFPLERSKMMSEMFLTTIGRMMNNWVHAEINTVRSLANAIEGEYVLLRKSSEFPDTVLKSEVTLACDRANDIMIMHHDFIDRRNAQRQSAGVLSLVRENLYGLCTIEERQAIEFFAFSLPIQVKAITNLNGFTITVDLSRSILEAKVVLARKTPYWDNLPKRFSTSIVENGKNDEAAILLTLLDEGRSTPIPS